MSNWPIRVGGEYLFGGYPEQSAIVTAINGDRVYFNRTLRGGGNSLFPSGDLSARIFRGLLLPEDQSPIPALISALQSHHLACMEHEPSYPGSAVCKETEAALAKAVPEAEEVSA